MNTCSIDGCDGQVRAWGWCNMHYRRWRKTGETGPAIPLDEVTRQIKASGCRMPGCDKPAKSAVDRLCIMHWTRQERHGDPNGTLRAPSETSLEERLLSRIDRQPGGCWLYTGPTNAHGYGIVMDAKAEQSSWYAHRLSYTLHVGPIPDGSVLDHLCSVRRCVNPEHLEAVTQSENALRTVERGRHKGGPAWRRRASARAL